MVEADSLCLQLYKTGTDRSEPGISYRIIKSIKAASDSKAAGLS